MPIDGGTASPLLAVISAGATEAYCRWSWLARWSAGRPAARKSPAEAGL